MKRTGIAAFSDLRTPSAEGVRDAITVRPSASANFYVDSVDKAEGQYSTNFTISKNQSLFNGYFNRLTVAEVVLDWGIPNVASYWGNNTITIGNATTNVLFEVIIPDAFHTAIDVLSYIADEVNTAATTAGDPLRLTLSLDNQATIIDFISDGVGTDPFVILGSNPNSGRPAKLARQLFKSAQIDVIGGATAYGIQSPLVLGTRYIDIVSSQLTYNQELKDNTTATITRDVLYRWYFAYDNGPMVYDEFIDEIDPGQVGPPFIPPTYAVIRVDIPILQGYSAFVARRTPPVAKQIRWSPEQPIGQVQFQVYDDEGKLLDISPAAFPEGVNFQFQLSMLLSED